MPNVGNYHISKKLLKQRVKQLLEKDHQLIEKEKQYEKNNPHIGYSCNTIFLDKKLYET
jgi:IMP cyclohydrolase